MFVKNNIMCSLKKEYVKNNILRSFKKEYVC